MASFRKLLVALVLMLSFVLAYGDTKNTLSFSYCNTFWDTHLVHVDVNYYIWDIWANNWSITSFKVFGGYYGEFDETGPIETGWRVGVRLSVLFVGVAPQYTKNWIPAWNDHSECYWYFGFNAPLK